MTKKAKRRLSVHLTERSLKDIAEIEAYSIQQFGKRATNQYIAKLEAAISRISENSDLLCHEPPFHSSLKFYRVEKHLFACETGIDRQIIILTVLHSSMDILSRLAELEGNFKAEVEMLLQQLRRSKRK